MPRLSWEDKWEQNFALLEAFCAEYGRFPKQKDEYQGVKLGFWCANQRKDVAGGKCQPDRERRLREIGLIANNTFDVHWEQHFAMLQRFVDTYERFPIDTEYFENFNLGKWCSHQKQQAKLPNYSPERIAKLRDLGLFESTNTALWDRHYQSLERFVVEYQRLPKSNEVYEGFKLGAWCTEQKRKVNAGGYAPDRVERLEAIGLLDPTSKQLSWDEMYELLQRYVQEHNKFPVAKEQYLGHNLGNWCEMQKFFARNTNYPPERLQKLEEIGIFSTTREAKWEKHYLLLQQFVAEYGRLPKQKESYQGVNLGLWCTMQKQRYKKDSYPEEHRTKLQDIGLLPRESLSFF